MLDLLKEIFLKRWIHWLKSGLGFLALSVLFGAITWLSDKRFSWVILALAITASACLIIALIGYLREHKSEGKS